MYIFVVPIHIYKHTKNASNSQERALPPTVRVTCICIKYGLASY